MTALAPDLHRAATDLAQFHDNYTAIAEDTAERDRQGFVPSPLLHEACVTIDQKNIAAQEHQIDWTLAFDAEHLSPEDKALLTKASAALPLLAHAIGEDDYDGDEYPEPEEAP